MMLENVSYYFSVEGDPSNSTTGIPAAGLKISVRAACLGIAYYEQTVSQGLKDKARRKEVRLLR